MPMLDVMSPGIPNGLSQQLGGLADTLIQSPMKLAQMRMEQQRLNNESMYRQLMGQAALGRIGVMQGRNDILGSHYGNLDQAAEQRAQTGAANEKSLEGARSSRAQTAQDALGLKVQQLNAQAQEAARRGDIETAKLLEGHARDLGQLGQTMFKNNTSTDVVGNVKHGMSQDEAKAEAAKEIPQPDVPARGAPPQFSLPDHSDPAMDAAQDYLAPRQDAGQPTMPQAPAATPDQGPSSSDAATAGNNLARSLEAQSTLQPTTNVQPRGKPADPNMGRASTISGPPAPDATPGQNGAMLTLPRGPLQFAAGQVPQTTAGSGGVPPPLTGAPQQPLGAGQMGQLPGAMAPNALSPDDQRMMVRAKGWAALPQFQTGPMGQRYQAAIKAAQGGDQGAISLLRNTDAEMARRAANMRGAPNAPPQNGVMPTAAPQAPSPAQNYPTLTPQP